MLTTKNNFRAGITRALVAALALFAASQSSAAERAPVTHLAVPVTLLWSENFDRAELGPAWSTNDKVKDSPQARLVDGVLAVARDKAANHGAVIRHEARFTHGIIAFRFFLTAAGANFNLPIDDHECKEVHAGHVVRARVMANYVLTQDDKTGIMNLKVKERLADPATKAATEAELLPKSFRGAADCSPGQWHDAVFEIVGDEMLASIDGKVVSYVRSAGIAHPDKKSFAFTVDFDAVHFDDVRVWTAEPNKTWAEQRTHVIAGIKALPQGKQAK